MADIPKKNGGAKPAGAKGSLTVQEAGRLGGRKVAAERGKEFYEQIGHRGGQKVRELIERGKKAR